MSEINKMISELFDRNWSGAASNNLREARRQLYKNLTDQSIGYWSGHSAYYIMTKGGFLIDAKHVNGRPKIITALGLKFMNDFEANNA